MEIAGNKLTKNYSEWAIFSIINNAKLNEKTLVAWRIIGGKKVTVNVRIRVVRKFRSELVMTTENVRSKAMLSDLAAGTDKLNFFLTEEMVLFQSKVKSRDVNGDVTVTIPDLIAQIDRRKHLRFLVDENVDVGVEFFKRVSFHQSTTQTFKKSLYDLSAGGLSFIITKMESKFFSVGDKINGVKILIDDKEVMVDSEIVNIFTVEPNEINKLNYKGLKICIKYTSIALEDQKLLNDFVFKSVDFSLNVV